MAIEALMVADGPAVYYEANLRVVLEDHLTFLRQHPSTVQLNVTEGDAYRFEYDLYGFLRRFGVTGQVHWLVMRMNHMTDPSEFGPQYTELLVPSEQTVGQIVQSHQTTRRVN
jgi:hypothetical protein